MNLLHCDGMKMLGQSVYWVVVIVAGFLATIVMGQGLPRSDELLRTAITQDALDLATKIASKSGEPQQAIRIAQEWLASRSADAGGGVDVTIIKTKLADLYRHEDMLKPAEAL